jgi:MSHA pilin protein MshD
MKSRPLQRGVTLIELVVSITIIAIAAAVVMGTLAMSTTSSAQMMNRNQAALIANSYLQEALSRSFITGPGSTRANFDDVQDYNNLTDVGVRDHWNPITPIAGLTVYTISIKALPTALGGLTAANSVLVTVTVTDQDNQTYTISSYRTSHQ